MSLAIFISLLMYSTCFGHKHIHHQERTTILLNYHIGRVFLVRCVLVFRCGWVGVVSVLQAEPTTPTLGSMCVGVSVWSGWSGICVAG